MKLLLDTHVFLWSLFSPGKISNAALREIKAAANEVFVSVVTFFEISLKYALGKIELSGIKPDDLPGFASQMNFNILPLAPDEASSFHKLPKLQHKDPFDRIIIWQAIKRNMFLVSKDREFGVYMDFGLKHIR